MAFADISSRDIFMQIFLGRIQDTSCRSKALTEIVVRKDDTDLSQVMLMLILLLTHAG